MGYQDSDLAGSGQTLIKYPTPGKLFPYVCMDTLSLPRVGLSRMKPGATLTMLNETQTTITLKFSNTNLQIKHGMLQRYHPFLF